MIKLLDNRVLIRPIEQEAQSAGGIFLPSAELLPYRKGTVVGVGPGWYTEEGKLIKLEVNVGDTVLLGSDVGHEVKVSGELLVIVGEDDIMAVLE